MISATAEQVSLFDTRACGDAPELIDLLAQRWSPRSFDVEHIIGDGEIATLLEAGRWAPSSRNGQARRFILGRRGGELFGRITSTLAGNNALWAPQAALLLVGVLMRSDDSGREEHFAEYDLGQAIAHVGLQAEAMGFRMRQIGGFDRAELIRTLGLQAPYDPFIVAAIGRQAHAGRLHGDLAAREAAPRTRVPLEDMVLGCD